MRCTLLAAALAAAFSSVAAAQSVPVTLSEWKIEPTRDTVKAGSVTFRVKNDGTMIHALHVEGEGVKKETPQIAVGQSMSLTVNLKPGTYELICPMSDLTHKMAGMKKTIVAVAAPTAPKKPEL
jgi:uncharacterized cupredoxin-like copper-binding protein